MIPPSWAVVLLVSGHDRSVPPTRCGLGAHGGGVDRHRPQGALASPPSPSPRASPASAAASSPRRPAGHGHRLRVLPGPVLGGDGGHPRRPARCRPPSPPASRSCCSPRSSAASTSPFLPEVLNPAENLAAICRSCSASAPWPQKHPEGIPRVPDAGSLGVHEPPAGPLLAPGPATPVDGDDGAAPPATGWPSAPTAPGRHEPGAGAVSLLVAEGVTKHFRPDRPRLGLAGGRAGRGGRLRSARNGAGKTTLFNRPYGVIAPDHGWSRPTTCRRCHYKRACLRASAARSSASRLFGHDCARPPAGGRAGPAGRRRAAEGPARPQRPEGTTSGLRSAAVLDLRRARRRGRPPHRVARGLGRGRLVELGPGP